MPTPVSAYKRQYQNPTHKRHSDCAPHRRNGGSIDSKTTFCYSSGLDACKPIDKRQRNRETQPTKESTMPYKTVGRFYFKKTNSGNIIGEFSADGTETYTEGGDLRGLDKGYHDYSGTYYTTWRDEKKKPVFTELRISKKPKRLFDLVWSDAKGVTEWKGTGMLCDNILIGDYHSVATI